MENLKKRKAYDHSDKKSPEKTAKTEADAIQELVEKFGLAAKEISEILRLFSFDLIRLVIAYHGGMPRLTGRLAVAKIKPRVQGVAYYSDMYHSSPQIIEFPNKAFDIVIECLSGQCSLREKKRIDTDVHHRLLSVRIIDPPELKDQRYGSPAEATKMLHQHFAPPCESYTEIIWKLIKNGWIQRYCTTFNSVRQVAQKCRDTRYDFEPYLLEKCVKVEKNAV